MATTRRLAAILAADVAGYSRLMGADEEGTLSRLKEIRRELAAWTDRRRINCIAQLAAEGVRCTAAAAECLRAAPGRPVASGTFQARRLEFRQRQASPKNRVFPGGGT